MPAPKPGEGIAEAMRIQQAIAKGKVPPAYLHAWLQTKIPDMHIMLKEYSRTDLSLNVTSHGTAVSDFASTELDYSGRPIITVNADAVVPYIIGADPASGAPVVDIVTYGRMFRGLLYHEMGHVLYTRLADIDQVPEVDFHARVMRESFAVFFNALPPETREKLTFYLMLIDRAKAYGPPSARELVGKLTVAVSDTLAPWIKEMLDRPTSPKYTPYPKYAPYKSVKERNSVLLGVASIDMFFNKDRLKGNPRALLLGDGVPDDVIKQAGQFIDDTVIANGRALKFPSEFWPKMSNILEDQRLETQLAFTYGAMRESFTTLVLSVMPQNERYLLTAGRFYLPKATRDADKLAYVLASRSTRGPSPIDGYLPWYEALLERYVVLNQSASADVTGYYQALALWLKAIFDPSGTLDNALEAKTYNPNLHQSQGKKDDPDAAKAAAKAKEEMEKLKALEEAAKKDPEREKAERAMTALAVVRRVLARDGALGEVVKARGLERH